MFQSLSPGAVHPWRPAGVAAVLCAAGGQHTLPSYIARKAAMVRTQIYLTDAQKRQLERLAAASGKRQSEMIREAIDGYLAREEPKDWREAFRSVRGTWAGRGDPDDFVRDLRGEWERRLERAYRR
jgi:predicted DNA-binding protein